MAFGEFELKQIENAVGELCKRRFPAHPREQLRTVYAVTGHDVTVYEERPRWDRAGEWISHGIAKFKYNRTRNVWKLYWMRADLKWHLYEPLLESRTINRLFAEVDKDPHGTFIG